MQDRIENLGIRLQPFNRLTFPVILNQIETAHLDQYFRVRMIENPAQLHQFIKESEKGLLLYSFMTPQLPQILKEISWINRYRRSSLKTLAGGPHTTGDPESSLKLGFDYVFRGAAEMGFGSFIQNYLEGKLPPAPAIFKTADIDWLDRSLPISRLLATSPPLEITRGCYWNCRFCQTSCQNAKHRSLDSIKIYYQGLKQRGHHRRMSFICPSAFEYGARNARQLSLMAVKELLEYCKSNGTSHLEFGIFPSETRPNTFSEEFVALISQFCSNQKICIGGQTGSDRLLKLIRRGHYHLRPYVDMIFGFPEENSQDRRETLQLIKKLATTYRTRIHLHYFIPLAGTELAQSRPKALDYKTIDTLNKFEHDGLCTGWWKNGMRLSDELLKVKDYLKDQIIDYQSIQLTSC
jgi:B12-binding domain/radical SAM domain protein